MPNAVTSSPGLAFLLATIGAFGEDGWQDYWAALKRNGVQVADGWSDAYYDRLLRWRRRRAAPDRRCRTRRHRRSPCPEGGTEPTTGALLDTCFRQVEYAGRARRVRPTRPARRS